MQALTTAPFPAQCRVSGRKTSAPSFSLEKERGGLCVKHSDFSGVCLRDWLLSHQSQSADGTQQIQDIWGPPRTKKVVWTSTQTHHSSSSWPTAEWMGGKLQLQLPSSPWGWKELDLASNFLTSLEATQGTGFYLTISGPGIQWTPQGLQKTKGVF